MARFAKLGHRPARNIRRRKRCPRRCCKAVQDGMADAWATFKEYKETRTRHRQADQRRRIRHPRVSEWPLHRPHGGGRARHLRQLEGRGDLSGLFRRQREEAAERGERYGLRFAPGDLPPVNAFWSLTLYELPSSLLSANPLNRYLINSSMLPGLKRDDDGGVTLAIQHADRAPGKRRTGCPRRPGRSSWSCGSIGRRPRRSMGEWKAPPLVRGRATARRQAPVAAVPVTP